MCGVVMIVVFGWGETVGNGRCGGKMIREGIGGGIYLIIRTFDCLL